MATAKLSPKMAAYLYDSLRHGGTVYLGSNYTWGHEYHRADASTTLQGLIKRGLMRTQSRRGDNRWGYVDALLTEEGWKYVREHYTFYGCEELPTVKPQLATVDELIEWMALVDKDATTSPITVSAELTAQHSLFLQRHDVLLTTQCGRPRFITRGEYAGEYLAVNCDTDKPYPVRKQEKKIYHDEPVTLFPTNSHRRIAVLWERSSDYKYKASIYSRDPRQPFVTDEDRAVASANIHITYGFSTERGDVTISWPSAHGLSVESAEEFQDVLQTATRIVSAYGR